VALYKVLAEQKITKKVLVVVEANSDEEALDKVCSRDIISVESTLDTKIDGFLPLEADEY
jgi:5S rRNA maturation endonuclease (ribonuclease M5)